MKVYTKKGDAGKSSVIGKHNIPKDTPLFEAIGCIDELNAYLGVQKSGIAEIDALLTTVQSDLFALGAYLAGSSVKSDWENKTTQLEAHIDKLETQNSELKNFILPFGMYHYARSICRRAERRLVGYARTQEQLDPGVLMYVNRLSDLLFVLARYVNLKHGYTEVIWKTHD